MSDPPRPTADEPTAPTATPSDEDDLGDRVEAALRGVRDPSIGTHVIEAGLIENVTIEGGDVTVAVDVSGFSGPENALLPAIVEAVDGVEGVANARVEPAEPSSEDRTPGVAEFDRVIAVASAKGGVGKSTVATSLACALADGEEVALFDADVHGPNVPRLLDVEGPIRSSAEGDPLPVEAGGLDVMSVGLMADGAPLGWRGAMAHDAVEDLFESTAWKRTDTLVIDLPPGTGDVVLTTLQSVPVDGVVVVTTRFPAAVDDTERTVELFREDGIPVLGTVVNMAGFTCPTCGDDHDLFRESAAERIDADVLAELPFDPDLQGTPAPGSVPPAVERLGDAVREAAATAGEVDVPECGVDIRGLAPQERKEQVRAAWSECESGDPFAVVSDRDPTPIREFLASVADVEPSEVDPFEVSRATPAAWLVRTERP